MAYDDVERSTMNRVNELWKQDQQDLPKNINISVGRGQPVSNTTVNDNSPEWTKWAALALQGIGAGARGFAKGFGIGQGLDMSGFNKFGEDVADAYRKKRKEAEEKEAKENQQAEQNNNVIKPVDNDNNKTAWIDYANKYWRMG